MSEVLQFAETVAALVPVFTAPPSSGDREFHRPPGWQHLRRDGNEMRLKEWQPGWAVCAVTGGPLAVVDVDPRNGGNVQRVAELLDALNVRVYAEVETPGGGRHFYVTGHPGLRNVKGNLPGYPGVDVQAHGANVYLPGTQRPRYDGGGYTVLEDDLAALADGGDPDGAAALADWVATHTRDTSSSDTGRVLVPAPPWPGGEPDERQAAYLQVVLANQRTKVAKAVQGNRNDTLYRAALKCGSYVAGAGLKEAQVIEVLLDAAVANGLVAEDGKEAVVATIRSGLDNGKQNPRAVPDPSPVTTVNGVSVDSATGEVLDGAPPRRVTLTAASAIKPQRVVWLWDGRLALGTLGLLAGREGLGKSTLAYWLAAQVTRGLLPGEYHGKPKSVLVSATEDSWEHTIVPRLIAAEADLDRVYRTEVVTSDDLHFHVSLPRDLPGVQDSAREVDAALLLLDPLMSRLSESIDTHKDGEVRRALEPLVATATSTGLAVLGLIHHNKSGSGDPLQLVMGSRAFTAVARSVHTVAPDPDDETHQRRLFGTPKNNLGRTDQPTLSFTIDSAAIDTDDGTAWTGRVVWGAEMAENIEDTMRRALEPEHTHTAASEAADWLHDYLRARGGVVPSKDAKKAGQAEGHSLDALQRARKRLRLWVKSDGFPRVTYWGDPALADPDPPDATQQ